MVFDGPKLQSVVKTCAISRTIGHWNGLLDVLIGSFLQTFELHTFMALLGNDKLPIAEHWRVTSGLNLVQCRTKHSPFRFLRNTAWTITPGVQEVRIPLDERHLGAALFFLPQRVAQCL